MSSEQQEFLLWISEQCKSLGASPEMHDEMQTLASRVDLAPTNGLQPAPCPKDTKSTLKDSLVSSNALNHISKCYIRKFLQGLQPLPVRRGKYEWQGRIWLNPPYGRDVFRWLDKLRQHKSGITLSSHGQKQQAFTIPYGVPQMPYSFLGVACASTTLTEKKAAQPTRRLALCRTV